MKQKLLLYPVALLPENIDLLVSSVQLRLRLLLTRRFVSAVLAMAACLYVRLSVCLKPKWLNESSSFLA